jgi:hypothetical protein
MMIKCGSCGKCGADMCGADTPVREKLLSAMGFRIGSFERARLQPGRYCAPKLGALALEGGRSL